MLGLLGSQLETAHAAQGTVAGDGAGSRARLQRILPRVRPDTGLGLAQLTRLPVIPFRKTAARFERAELESGVQADAG